MKLSNYQIMNSENTLFKLKDMELPIKVAYKLNKAIKEIAVKIELINEVKNELIMKHGECDNGNYFINNENKDAVEKFVKDFKEVLNIEEEVNIDPFDLNDFESVKLSSAEFEAISFLFE